MVEKIKAWLASHTAETHYIAVSIAFLVGAYFQVPAFHDSLNKIYGEFPQTLKELITTVIALIMFYRRGQQAN